MSIPPIPALLQDTRIYGYTRITIKGDSYGTLWPGLMKCYVMHIYMSQGSSVASFIDLKTGETVETQYLPNRPSADSSTHLISKVWDKISKCTSLKENEHS